MPLWIIVSNSFNLISFCILTAFARVLGMQGNDGNNVCS